MDAIEKLPLTSLDIKALQLERLKTNAVQVMKSKGVVTFRTV